MTGQCNPANLQILEGDSIEHFQLPQCSIRSLPDGVHSQRDDGRYISSIPSHEYNEFNNSKYFRICLKSFSALKGSNLEDLRNHCRDAHLSEEFFVTTATDQWLRTKFMSSSGWTRTWRKENDDVKRSIIKSNVLPYDPYWGRSPAGENGEGKRVHFPCRKLNEESEVGSTLMRKLQDWTPQEDGRSEKCDISKHVHVPEGLKSGNIEQPRRKLWEIALQDVDTRKLLYSYGGTRISQVTWRYGNFIQKQVQNHVVFQKEVKSMQMLCHPHIVYTFGVTGSSDREGGSLYMEWMDSDLGDVILKKRNQGKRSPPFLHHDSVDILLQIAKAMAHMHEMKVIHGDLKPGNIFVTEFEISKKRYQYLAKVADFGEAEMHMMDTDPFTPSRGTPFYAAPEVLKFFFEKKKAGEERDVISVPEKTDVYSFGLIAFEVLTGTTMEEFYGTKPIREMKEDVIYHELRPDLRVKCNGINFLNDEQLILLIESCWESDPSKRLPFSTILKTLESVRDRIQELPTSSNDHPRQGNLVDDDNSGAPQGPLVSESNGHHLSPPVEANNTSVASLGRVHKPSQPWKHALKRRMRALFKCTGSRGTFPCETFPRM